MSTIRKPSDGPFSWQSKEALNSIEVATDGRPDRAFVLAVYSVLCRIASNKTGKGETEGPFQVSKGELASRSGVSYRKCADVLSFLKGIGLLRIQENRIEGTKEKGPNTYSLLPLGTPCLTSGTPCLRLGTDTKQASLPRIEKNTTEEQSEERKLNGAAAPQDLLFKEPKAGLPPLPDSLAASPDFKTAWADWIQHRKEIKKPLKPTMTAEQLKGLEAVGPRDAVKFVRRAISGGWQGLTMDRPLEVAGRPVSGAVIQKPKPAAVPDNNKYTDEG